MYILVTNNTMRKPNKYGGFIKCNQCQKEQPIFWSSCEFEDEEGYILKSPLKCKCGHIDSLILKSIPDIQSSNNSNISYCPTCGSTNIHKISTTNKVGSALVFGVFAMGNISKTFKCNSCGYKW